MALKKRTGSAGPRKPGTSAKVKAWAWRSGLIEFGKNVPPGAFPILSADGICFSRQRIEAAARHSYDGQTLLVPGVPEAKSNAKAYEAFEQWVRWMRKPAAIVAS